MRRALVSASLAVCGVGAFAGASPAFAASPPTFTFEEIAKHAEPGNVWVAYQGGVYDVSDFVQGHPGGESKIMMAAGGSIEPYWALYQQHDQDYVRELLSEYKIGELAPGEVAPEFSPSGDNPAYANEPRRHPALVVRSNAPFNAETPAELLSETFLTPNELFYKRNHFPVPVVDPEDYVLQVNGRSYTLQDLKKFKMHTVTSTVQCAGNRRDEMRQYKNLRGGHWDAGAISNATWTGVYLSEVLRDAGVEGPSDAVKHVHFLGLDGDDERSYGASIPAEKAFDEKGDVLLALQMNGEQLPRDHGYPVRALIPGTVGARNVKWLSKVDVSDEESSAHWQTKDYRGFPPNVDWDNVDWPSMPSIQALPVTSAITFAKLDSGSLTVKGYAYSGGGKKVIRVDLTTDDGETWTQAELKEKEEQPLNRDWAWTLWEAEIPVQGNSVEIASRAVDESYNSQPESSKSLWNLRGVLNNAWYRRTVAEKN